MQYVKTSGIGFDFTDNESEAMHFETASQAQRLKDRLGPQFPNYLWEIVVGQKGSYLIVHPKVGGR